MVHFLDKKEIDLLLVILIFIQEMVLLLNDLNDEKAIKLLEEVFHGRKIEHICAREVLLGGGNSQCITQQLPE